MAYYEQTQRVCAEKARDAFGRTTDLRGRLGAALHTKLDVLARDRKLLSALFATMADPSSDLSVLGSKAGDVREDSKRIFDEALGDAPELVSLDTSTRRVLSLALWSLHMGLMLCFIRDDSPRAEKTRHLVEAPAHAPMLGAELAGILSAAGLLDRAR